MSGTWYFYACRSTAVRLLFVRLLPYSFCMLLLFWLILGLLAAVVVAADGDRV